MVDRNNKPYRDFARYGLAYNSVYVIAYHVFIVDKQIIVAVATIPVLFAESCRHIAIFAWLAPQRTVIAAKVEASGGKLFTLLQCRSETSHIPTAAILLDGGKSDTLAVDACAGRDAVLVEGFIQIGISDFAKPIIRMRGKSGKFLSNDKLQHI